MAESLTIARPYAEAAFKAAIEAQALPAWTDMLGRLTSVLGAPEAAGFISNPGNSTDQVAGIIADVTGLMSPEQRNFVGLLAQNERLSVVPEIATLFAELRNEHEKVLDARVSSAFPLSEAQIADIRTTLETKYGRRVDISVSIDPELIGGVSIRIGDEVMDASVRGKLAQLASTLMTN